VIKRNEIGQNRTVTYASSGTLDSKKGHHVRMALLSIIFKSAGLPGQYNLAQLVLWLKTQGVLDQIQEYAENNSKAKPGIDPWQYELKHLHASPIIAQALLDFIPDLASDVKEVRSILREQYKNVDDGFYCIMKTDGTCESGFSPLRLVTWRSRNIQPRRDD